MESANQYTAPTPPLNRYKYQLPYANSVLESFLTVAENAYLQARSNQEACVKAMANNENTMSDIVPAFPHMQKNYSSSIIYSTRALMHSAESAYQAQSSVCEALDSALKVAKEEKERLELRLQELSTEVAVQKKNTAALRKAFTAAADKHSLNTKNVYATEEAQELLGALENVYQKYELQRRLSKYVEETDANISYLTQAYAEAQNSMNEISVLAKRAGNEWRQIIELFNVHPEQFANQGETMIIFQEQLKNRPTEEIPPQETMPELKEDIDLEEYLEEEPYFGAWATIWAYTKVILIALLIALVLRAYVFDLTVVDGTSMYPRLNDNDKLIAEKISYHFSDPRRGDIVVINAPDLPGKDYIKRIIALPNERLTIDNGKVYINGKELIEPYLDGIDTSGDIDMVIPDGYYFVMGDNRPDSRDSREEKISVISIDDINSKAVFRLLPLRDFGSLYKSKTEK